MISGPQEDKSYDSYTADPVVCYALSLVISVFRIGHICHQLAASRRSCSVQNYFGSQASQAMMMILSPYRPAGFESEF